jgi:hypothetical protein
MGLRARVSPPLGSRLRCSSLGHTSQPPEFPGCSPRFSDTETLSSCVIRLLHSFERCGCCARMIDGLAACSSCGSRDRSHRGRNRKASFVEGYTCWKRSSLASSMVLAARGRGLCHHDLLHHAASRMEPRNAATAFSETYVFERL